ncbi:short chain dehydrogenase [Phyllobacterium salinisoli]|uniref:Short chain dehydrogenase n=1 Tax=Phyllobacterium salinisoli TaxID=1899321 RepID=A0A368KB23_9HYPH|nr:SDR family oxidoreductase [Phyllobacterium salinisoli]RCS25693.1 short chain dehydrogenase [Phyllobacterium salinisoli]
MSKTWFITGASAGLGRMMTERLLARGDRVVGSVRREDALEDLQRQYGDRLMAVMLDLTDRTGIRAAVDNAFARMSRIDNVVSNAGYGLFGAAEEVTDDQIDHQIATNLTGSIALIRAALPHLRLQGGGRIVQVSSEGGQIAYPNFSLYHATKWGIEGFIEAVAQEVAAFGIDFLIIEPGPTATNFGAGLVQAAPMEIYKDSPAGEMRRILADGSWKIKGDAGQTVEAMITVADQKKPPFRLALGSSAYDGISRALEQRLTEVREQREVAYSADSKLFNNDETIMPDNSANRA